MAKKSGLVENTVEEATPTANVSVEETPIVETPIVETPKVETQTPGHPSRDFFTPING